MQFGEDVEFVRPSEVDALLFVAGQLLRGISPEAIPKQGSVSESTVERLKLIGPTRSVVIRQ